MRAVIVTGRFGEPPTVSVEKPELPFRRFLARQPAPFAATLEEIGEDRACIRPTN